MRVDDTIAAVASAPGGARRGIVRLSGPQAIDCLERCFTAADRRPLSAIRRACVVPGTLFVAPPVGELPVDLFVWPTSHSYTGQAAAELHTIGAPPLLEAAVRRLCAAGARLAEPGEFTLRAFLAGRIDLTQAEAVLGVIDARGEADLRTALAQLAGNLAAPLAGLRESLLDLLADLEAGLDFVEEDIAFITPEELESRLASAADEVSRLSGQMASRARTSNEPRVVLRGWPNVGKSSLLNALAREDASLVSDVPGTTRDYLCRRVSVSGMVCLLIDTAGVEEHVHSGGAGSSISAGTQAMTRQQSAEADLVLLCLDATRPLNDWERGELARPPAVERLCVLTKTDLVPSTGLLPGPEYPTTATHTSSRTGAGLDELWSAIRNSIENSPSVEASVVAGTALRCGESLRLAAESLTRARDLAHESRGEELVAAEVRAALGELGKVVGAVYTDDLLDRVFSRFCIGK